VPFDSAAPFTNRERANRAIATALLSIRDKLKATAGPRCPTLKAALLRYLMMTRPGISVKELLAPYPSDELICWPVSARVGNVKNNDPSLIEPITPS
jgi:hypothetical protein